MIIFLFNSIVIHSSRKSPVPTGYLFKSLFGTDYFSGGCRKGKRTDDEKVEKIRMMLMKKL